MPEISPLPPIGTIRASSPARERSLAQAQDAIRRYAAENTGQPWLTGAYAWKSMLANKARLAFGSDYPVENPNPFTGWAVAFTRQDGAAIRRLATGGDCACRW